MVAQSWRRFRYKSYGYCAVLTVIAEHSTGCGILISTKADSSPSTEPTLQTEAFKLEEPLSRQSESRRQENNPSAPQIYTTSAIGLTRLSSFKKNENTVTLITMIKKGKQKLYFLKNEKKTADNSSHCTDQSTALICEQKKV